jgi:hypothetical protein
VKLIEFSRPVTRGSGVMQRTSEGGVGRQRRRRLLLLLLLSLGGSLGSSLALSFFASLELPALSFTLALHFGLSSLALAFPPFDLASFGLSLLPLALPFSPFAFPTLLVPALLVPSQQQSKVVLRRRLVHVMRVALDVELAATRRFWLLVRPRPLGTKRKSE